MTHYDFQTAAREARIRANTPASLAAYERSHLAFYEKHHPFWARLLRLYRRL